MSEKSQVFYKKVSWKWVAIILFALSAVIWTQTSLVRAEKVGTAVGNRAPSFTLADLNGRPVALQAVVAKNKVTVLNFWGIWCPYCVQEIPDFVSFYREYRDRGVAILGIDVGDDPGDLPAFVKKQQMTYPILIDKGQAISGLYRVSGFPTTFLIDRQGKIGEVIIGATNRETLKKRVEAMLAER